MKLKNFKNVAIIAISMFALILTSCEKEIPVSGVQINKKTLSLLEGSTEMLVAMISPADANEKTVEWTSSDKAIATVADNGMVTAIAEGQADITVTTKDGAKTDVCKVTVTKKIIPVESVKFEVAKYDLLTEDTQQLVPIFTPENATNKNVAWKSSAQAFATVDDKGLVTAVSEGRAMITVTTEDGAKVATCKVTVIAGIDYIDEYGENRGKGIAVGALTWAPVNCGYHPTDYPYGKLYQWGRKYGQGYGEEGGFTMEVTPTTNGSPLESPEDNIFYKNNRDLPNGIGDWYAANTDEKLTEWANKNEKIANPCPEGWRVPTNKELSSLVKNKSAWTVKDEQNGYWFSGATPYAESGDAKVFFPATGYRLSIGRDFSRGTKARYWSSTVNAENVWYLSVDDANAYVDNIARASGIAVRCVME